MTENNKRKRIMVGEVVSDKMDKTIVVRVSRAFTHPLVQKVMRATKKYKVHDEHEQASVGDIVEIVEGKPASRSKNMYLSAIVRSKASSDKG